MNTIKTEYDNPRIIDKHSSNAYQAHVYWDPLKSIWYTTMSLIGLVGALFTYSHEALSVFLISSAVTICLGHSLGMHRRFIHHSYECPRWLEYFFVYLGVLVGLAGPIGMMFTHDLRDWAQRQARSHPYFGHSTHFFKDAFWQLHCDIKLDKPPGFNPEKTVKDDPFYQFLEATWMWQQLPLALLFYFIGGLEWVIWGVCLRVFISITGHWLIGHFAHNKGQRDWHVSNASVQGYNVRFCGLITMGECWHNNHHAYPGSALLGIKTNQTDPGWWVLQGLSYLGLVWNIKKPEDLPERQELTSITANYTSVQNNATLELPQHVRKSID